MDNFLTRLYKQYFDSIEEHKKYRAIHDFDSDASAQRNDEKIGAAMEKTQTFEKLIDEYMKHQAR